MGGVWFDSGLLVQGFADGASQHDFLPVHQRLCPITTIGDTRYYLANDFGIPQKTWGGNLNPLAHNARV